jgi:hypothetical protein
VRKGIRPATLALAALLAACGPGCRYLANRGKDLTDIVAPGISPGGGIGARVSATRLVALEIIAQKDEDFFGWRERAAHWYESAYGLPFSIWRMPAIGEGERPVRHWYDMFTTSRRLDQYPKREETEDRRHTLFFFSGGRGLRLIDFLDVEVGVSALIGGVELSLRPGQVLDFFLGWFGLDLSGDDTPASK